MNERTGRNRFLYYWRIKNTQKISKISKTTGILPKVSSSGKKLKNRGAGEFQGGGTGRRRKGARFSSIFGGKEKRSKSSSKEGSGFPEQRRMVFWQERGGGK